MKFASKLVMAVAMGATALTALTGMAYAQETYGVTKYEYGRDDGVDTHGLSFGLSGRYENGLTYEMELMSVDQEGTATTGADLEMAYRFSGLAGPVALYEYRSIDGNDENHFLLGIEGGAVLVDVDVSGKLLVDTDDTESYRLAIGGKYELSKHLSLSSDLTHFHNKEMEDQNLLELGARYHLMGNMYADVGAHYELQGHDEKTGLHMGLGFDF